jgi:beta-N-acetylhexosaminidase
VRPDAIVVEMGVAVSVVGATHIATYGATSASAAAAAGLLAS